MRIPRNAAPKLPHYPLTGYSRRCVGLLPLLLTALSLSACTTARVNHFKEFAHAGTSYVNAANVAITEAGNAAIDADSIVLREARAQLAAAREGMTQPVLVQTIKQDSQELARRITTHNELLKERLQLLGDIQVHMLLMRNYFVALGALAQSDEPSSIGEAAKGTVNALGKVSDRIKNAKVGQLPIANFVEPVVTIVVAQFQRAALEKELNTRATMIANELDLQKAAMEAIASDMRDNLMLIQAQEEQNIVLNPYRLAVGPLPTNWSDKRKEFLKKNQVLQSVEAAATAANSLKMSFIALVENRLGSTDIEALLQDINRILTLIEAIRGSQ
jgi:hypothetical protein